MPNDVKNICANFTFIFCSLRHNRFLLLLLLWSLWRYFIYKIAQVLNIASISETTPPSRLSRNPASATALLVMTSLLLLTKANSKCHIPSKLYIQTRTLIMKRSIKTISAKDFCQGNLPKELDCNLEDKFEYQSHRKQGGWGSPGHSTFGHRTTFNDAQSCLFKGKWLTDGHKSCKLCNCVNEASPSHCHTHGCPTPDLLPMVLNMWHHSVWDIRQL